MKSLINLTGRAGFIGSHLVKLFVKRSYLYFLFMFFLCACTSLDEVNNRLDILEGEVSDLKTAINILDNAYKSGKTIKIIEPIFDENGDAVGWTLEFTDGNYYTIRDGKNSETIFRDVEIREGKVVFTMANGDIFLINITNDRPRILSFGFLSDKNVNQLIENVNCTIEGDSLITCWIPYIMDNKKMTPHFVFSGLQVSSEGVEVRSDETILDFSRPLTLTVSNDTEIVKYKVLIHAFTGLPVMWIETENREPITSTEEYLNAHMRLVEDVQTRSPGEIIEADLGIKGRGHSTWNVDKKPYRLKFKEKISLLGEKKDKSWVLLANYFDKSFLRNKLAFEMGKMSLLEYTPQSHFVELMLNGQYNGTYELCDKIKVSEDRVNVGKDGFLIEIDAASRGLENETAFRTKYIEMPINIKEPEVVFDDENYKYIKDYVLKAEEILFSDTFADSETGWKKYLDMDSFVEWYLIHEISRNNDAWRWSSTYMNLKRGDKLKMGPIWDFDRSFGNAQEFNNFEIEGFWIKNMSWFSRLFQDPVFVSRVKERYAFYYAHKEEFLSFVNANAQYLSRSMVENNNKWGILYNYISPNADIWGNYYNEISALKQWLSKRMDWLNVALSEL